MTLADPITTLPGVGSIMAEKLDKLGITSVFDLVYHLPFRYEDRSLVSKINMVQPGETVTITASLESIKNAFTQKGRTMQIAQIHDGTKSLQVIWFNQIYLVRALKVGEQYSFYGKVDWFGKKLSLISPDYELLDQESLHTGRIVPVYPETAGISSKWLRAKIDFLLKNFVALEHLAPKNYLEAVHFPKQLEEVPNAKQRLAFDELFLLQIRALKHKQEWQSLKLAHRLSVAMPQIDAFLKSLPFKLTAGQYTAVHEILADLDHTQPMNRLLEGDVGSGKTVVAAAAIYATHLNHKKSLVMAPTQLLAQQHFQTLQNFLSPFDIKIGLVTGSSKNYDQSSDIVVGTQALLADKFSLPDVALVIIDEQHRFGVGQRTLVAGKQLAPHILTMTATPIPRTIALSLFGDLDLSLLDESPPGRLPIKTWVVPEEKRTAAYDWIRKQSTQAFIVCPLIEDSETMQSVKAASSEFEKLKTIFPNKKLGLIHGRLKGKEKNEVLDKFRRGELDILVATPVVEVGIDIPGANIMVIEDADRFGLAQLHQLRGRIGRGDQQAYCLLFSNQDSERLAAMEKYSSGVKLAEIDMEIRGPGNVFGVAQHGRGAFKIASYADLGLLSEAKTQAQRVLPDLPKLPLLLQLVEKDKIASVSPN